MKPNYYIYGGRIVRCNPDKFKSCKIVEVEGVEVKLKDKKYKLVQMISAGVVMTGLSEREINEYWTGEDK